MANTRAGNVVLKLDFLDSSHTISWFPDGERSYKAPSVLAHFSQFAGLQVETGLLNMICLYTPLARFAYSRDETGVRKLGFS